MSHEVQYASIFPPLVYPGEEFKNKCRQMTNLGVQPYWQHGHTWRSRHRPTPVCNLRPMVVRCDSEIRIAIGSSEIVLFSSQPPKLRRLDFRAVARNAGLRGRECCVTSFGMRTQHLPRRKPWPGIRPTQSVDFWTPHTDLVATALPRARTTT